MTYKIEEIEGVGAVYGEKLKAAGIATVEELLEQGASPSGRAKIAGQTGITETLLLKWVNHADMFRIKGVAGQFSELLEAAGVDTVKEFGNRVPENLHDKLVEVNGAKNLSGRVPSVDQLREMIEIAKALAPKVSH